MAPPIRQYNNQLRPMNSYIGLLSSILVFCSGFVNQVSSFQTTFIVKHINKDIMSSSSSTLQAAAAKSTQFITNKRCPFAQKAWIALESSDTTYEMKEIGLYGSGG